MKHNIVIFIVVCGIGAGGALSTSIYGTLQNIQGALSYANQNSGRSFSRVLYAWARLQAVIDRLPDQATELDIENLDTKLQLTFMRIDLIKTVNNQFDVRTKNSYQKVISILNRVETFVNASGNTMTDEFQIIRRDFSSATKDINILERFFSDLSRKRVQHQIQALENFSNTALYFLAFIIVFTIMIVYMAFRAFYSEKTLRKQAIELNSKTDLLETVLSSIKQGLVAYDSQLRLITCNEQFKKIRDVPDELAAIGASFEDWMRFDIERGEFGTGDVDTQFKNRMDLVLQGENHDLMRTRPDGRIIEISGGPLPCGGFVSTFSDVTEREIAEKKLKSAFDVISSSIEYASRIQHSILPNTDILKTVLQDHFVLWEPRDVVGGDMYWVGTWGNGFLIILGDCTGHGVPGAFITLIVAGALERALGEIKPGNLSSLVTHLHQYIQTSLGQHCEGGDSDDGIELGACYFVPGETTMTFVGARFELFCLEDGTITSVKGTKQGMGYRGIPYKQEYAENRIQLKTGQSFYMTSDGLVDQVGGDRRRMFGKKRFKDLLTTLQNKSMKKQKQDVYQSLLEYQGHENRRDDICVIAFRIT